VGRKTGRVPPRFFGLLWFYAVPGSQDEDENLQSANLPDKTERTSMTVKKTGIIWAVATIAATASQAGTLFKQDFSSSVNYTDYVKATTPSQNQFTLINGGPISIVDGRLNIVSATGGNVQRWVDMVGTPVGALSFSYDLSVTYTGVSAGTRLITGVVGEPVAGGHWMAWGIDATGVDNEWKVFGTSTNRVSESATVKMFLNNTGSDITYLDPTGGTQLLANDKYDIWLGDVRIQAAGTPTQPDKLLTSFTLAIRNTGSSITYSFDNFSVKTIPGPATLGLYVIH
jgi:hypothetical protein